MANNIYPDLTSISHSYLNNSLRVPMWVEDGSYVIETGLNRRRIFTDETLPDEVKALLSMIHSLPPYETGIYLIGNLIAPHERTAYIAPDERYIEIGWRVTDNLYMLVLEREVLNRLDGAR